jgi:hypothetical protein
MLLATMLLMDQNSWVPNRAKTFYSITLPISGQQEKLPRLY